MHRYYLTVSPDPINNQINNDTSHQMSPKLKNDAELKLKQKNEPACSPKTLKKNISNENFIKYQWAWVI